MSRFDEVCNLASEEFAQIMREKMLRELALVERGFTSPIEALFAAGLLHCLSTVAVLRGRYAFLRQPGVAVETIVAGLSDRIGIEAWPQVAIGKYRADFLLAYAPGEVGNILVAIECDGHNFHEKTKEQAAHDKTRDNYFQCQNISVLRYSGKTIWASPVSAARDALIKCEEIALRRIQGVGELKEMPLSAWLSDWPTGAPAR